MRLIDADKLIERINNAERISSIPYAEQMKSNLLFLAKTQPTIDAVEVVRCKDCKYGEVDDEAFPWQYFCGYTGDNWNDENHFCGYGERKNDS